MECSEEIVTSNKRNSIRAQNMRWERFAIDLIGNSVFIMNIDLAFGTGLK